MMKTLFFVLNLILLYSVAHMACGQINSANNGIDSVRIMTLLDSIRHVAYKDLDQANRMMQEIAILLKQQKDTLLLARCNGVIGAVLSNSPDDSVKKVSIGYIEKSIAYFQAVGNHAGVQTNFSNLSAVYSNFNQYPKALSYALKALQLAQSRDFREAWPDKTGFAYSSVAYIYLKINWLDSAIVNYHQARKYFEKTDHPAQYATSNFIGNAYRRNQQYEHAHTVLYEAYMACRQNGYSNFQGRLAKNLAAVFYETQDYLKAIQYYRQSMDLMELSHHSRVYVASCFIQLNKPDSAAYYLEAIDESEMTLSDLPAYYYVKASLSETRGNTTSALQYRYKAKILQDSLRALENIPETTRILVAEEGKKQEDKKSHYERLIANKNIFLTSVAMLFLLVALLGIWLYGRYSSSSTEMRRERTEKEHLNRKLVTVNIKLATKNEALVNAKIILKNLETDIRNETIKRELQTAQSHLEESLSLDKVWEDFFIHFNNIHPDLLEQWKNQYKLSKTEVRLCAFLKMHLSIKEISRILNVKTNTVKVTIYRIKKKLNVPDGQDLFDFLSKAPLDERI